MCIRDRPYTASELIIQKLKNLSTERSMLVADRAKYQSQLKDQVDYMEPVSYTHLDVYKRQGLYCIRIKNVHLLPEPFGTILLERGHDILYIGIASENLYNRFLNQELRAKGHGTFFRSMGAVLGYKPPKGSLIEKRNKKNYKFSKTDELKIIGWINENSVSYTHLDVYKRQVFDIIKKNQT